MLQRVKAIVLSIRERFAGNFSAAAKADAAAAAVKAGAARAVGGLANARGSLLALGVAGAAGYALYNHPPMHSVGPGEVGIRINQLTGGISEWRDGSVVVLPGLHSLRVISLRDETYRPEQIRRADGGAPVQSVEGLSFGVDLTVRYAVDADKVGVNWKNLNGSVAANVIEPAVQGIIYKTFARYTVREIFSTKRVEIQQSIEAELKTKLAADGVLLRAIHIGKVDLPAEYRRGMDSLLAEELATEKMRYTLELKDKRVRETELDGEADKMRREKAAEAAAREQIIAAKGQEEAMKHVLPFKQRQIEQRQLEAEADRVSRIRVAEGSAQARRVEAGGEADARQKLADAEAYRLERVGKANAEQMSREGVLVTRHPLLIQKTLADKLSDKIQVIIAPPPADGGFIGATLLGNRKRDELAAANAAVPAEEADGKAEK
jgi:regulator of protease activity HflC (stomatin/prohibitin superfamily)